MRIFGTHDFYLLRRPLRPVEDLLRLNQMVESGEAAAFADALNQLFSDAALEEGLYLASPALHEELLKWRESKADPKKSEKLFLSLYKYYIRLCTRCTPYGLFAGCALGTISDAPTAVAFSPEDRMKKHARLDMNYVGEIVTCLLKDPVVREQVKFRPNSSLYQVGTTFRFVEYTFKKKRRSYVLSSVKATRYVKTVLEFAREGKYLREIVGILQENDFTVEEAAQYAADLIDAQLLVSDLEPTVTGPEFFETLLHRLTGLRGTACYTEALRRIAGLLDGQAHSVQRYTQIKSIIRENFTDTSSKDLVQTDLFFHAEANNLNRADLDRVVQQVEKLLFMRGVLVNDRLDAFRKKFYARFEDQEVPLLLALDSEVGVGYDLNVNGVSDYMPLLKDLSMPAEPQETLVPWKAFTQLQLSLLNEAAATGARKVQLRDEQLDKLGLKQPDPALLPASMYLFGSFLGDFPGEPASGNAGDRGRFLMHGMAGPSAANLLGRFCHGSAELTGKLQQCLREEADTRPDAIFAEVVHLPDARMGNILMRPTLREYEIPYLGQSSAPASHQLPPADLLVSVRNGKVVLRSVRLGKEVIPRLSSAHNFAKGLPMYKFLGDLQTQDQVARMFWSWGPFDQERFLPRVEYKNLIVSRASWQLKKEDFQRMPGGPDHALLAYFEQVRETYQLPRLVVLAAGDRELFLDLASVPALKLLKERLAKENVRLYECLGTPENCFVRNARGSYANEVVIPLRNVAVAPAAAGRRSELLADSGTVQRKFPVGSPWLYVKIYLGNKAADKILAGVLRPFLHRLVADGVVEKWFFIRYNDPEGHIRLRFYQGRNAMFWSDVLRDLYGLLNPYLQDGIIHKIQTDTYVRELERYGDRSVALAEEIFYRDSVAVVDFLDLLEGEEGERYRWLFALRGVDMLLDDFGYGNTRKLALTERLYNSFFREHFGDDKLRHALNDKFRQERNAIGAMLDPARDTAYLQRALDCFGNRSQHVGRVAAAIRDLYGGTPEHAAFFDNLVNSFVHLFLNRMFPGKQRLHELVVYHYLSKQYKSQLARSPVNQDVAAGY